MILYHATPALITSWIIPNSNGLHLGSYRSAKQALGRKMQAMNRNKGRVYKLEVSIQNSVDCLDQGEDWSGEIEFAKYQGYDSIRYVNKYEPCTSPSYVIWDAGKIISFEIVENV